ncbi:MAG: hypothetical protein Q7N50_03445 [Armatimonadota bacterium]|nr:hypothetical protein [Armatimonadota bacterium]
MLESMEKALDEAIAGSVNSILTPMGFDIRKVNWLEYVAESDKVQVYIAHARTTVKTAIGLLAEPRDLVELHWVLEALLPEMNEADRYPKQVRDNTSIQPELERQLHLLTNHCVGLLKGDLAVWARLREFMRDLGGRLRRDDESNEQYAFRLRRAALRAWERKHYWELSGLYGILFVDTNTRLTLKDHYRWYQARRHTFPIG